MSSSVQRVELSIGSGADRVLWDGGKRSEWR